MKKINNKRKELSIGILLILILLFTVIYLCFGICIGFLIDAFLNESIDDVLINLLFTLIVGIIYFVLLFILIRDKDILGVKPRKWYVNCILISLTLNLIITAITVFALQSDNGIINYIVGFSIFPFIGIITTPNIVKYVKKDTEKWKNIFYKNGNLDSIKNSKDYYRLQTPVSFEKKILLEVYKHQFLNVLVVIVIMLFVIFLGVNYMTTDHSYTSNIITNVVKIRAKKSFGFIFFLMIIFLVFGIPIITFYISNALKKIRVVKNHEYIAYHVIATSVNNSKITIYDKNKHYTYNYCTCVGIKEEEINNTPAILVFIPDDVLLFPEETK